MDNQQYARTQVDYERESKYNAGLAQIDRLNQLWLKCTSANEDAESEDYRIALERIWMELLCDMKFEEKLKAENLQTLITIARKSKHEDDLWNALWNFEIFLREAQTHQGKLAVYKNADDENID